MSSKLHIDLNKIYQEDCIKGMKGLPDNSVDIAIADPPYNLSKGGNWKWDNSVKLPGLGGDWNKVMQNWDDMPLYDYFTFTLQWLSEIKRVVKPTGSIWMHGTYHNIGIINFAMQMLDIEIINEVIWFKRNSFPNLSGRRLTASHETILWAHTGKSNSREYYFDYEASKELDFPEDNIKQQGKQMRTVWDIPNNKTKEELKYGKHPTQKPVRLIERMLRISAKQGDVVLSPFCGAGTDCVVSKKLGLNFIGFELEKEYIDVSELRLLNVNDFKETNTRHQENTNEKKTRQGKVTKKAKQEKPIQIEQISFDDSLNMDTNLISDDSVAEEKLIITEDLEKGKILLESVKEDVEVFEKTVEYTTIPSILKWTGSKRKQANEIFSYFPLQYDRYIEPFLGGGAVLFRAGKEGSIANDVYKPLIEFWQLVQNDPTTLINYYEQEWNKLQNSIPDYYYEVRDRFNTSPNGLDLSFLTRTCVNGIVRFNKDGEFNNSFHLSRKGMVPKTFAGIVKKWSEKIQGVNFTNYDYKEVLELTKKGDMVYLDPPYAGSGNRYIENLDVDSFFTELERLNQKDVKWILSFDGQRGDENFEYPVPIDLYKRKTSLSNGNSTLNQVLNGQVKEVKEALYINF